MIWEYWPRASAKSWVSRSLADLVDKTVLTQDELTLQRTAQDLDAELENTKNGPTDKAVEEAFNKVAIRYAYLGIPGFHTDYFLNPDYFSKETSQLIQTTIQAFL